MYKINKRKNSYQPKLCKQAYYFLVVSSLG